MKVIKLSMTIGPIHDGLSPEAAIEESRLQIKYAIFKELDSVVGKPAFRQWTDLSADGHDGEPEFPVEANGTITQDNLMQFLMDRFAYDSLSVLQPNTARIYKHGCRETAEGWVEDNGVELSKDGKPWLVKYALKNWGGDDRFSPDATEDVKHDIKNMRFAVWISHIVPDPSE